MPGSLSPKLKPLRKFKSKGRINSFGFKKGWPLLCFSLDSRTFPGEAQGSRRTLPEAGVTQDCGSVSEPGGVLSRSVCLSSYFSKYQDEVNTEKGKRPRCSRSTVGEERPMAAEK